MTLTNIRGRCGSLGTLQGNPGQTEIRDVTLKDIDVTAKDAKVRIEPADAVKVEDVKVNGEPLSLGK